MIEKLTAEAIDPALKLRYGRAKRAADLERTAVALEGNGFAVGRAANATEGVNKILVINREINPGRITVVLVDEVIGF